MTDLARSSLTDFALEVSRVPGGWAALVTNAAAPSRVAAELCAELGVLEVRATVLEAAGNPLEIAKAIEHAAGVVIAVFQSPTPDMWRQLDFLRSRMMRDEPVVLVLQPASLRALFDYAPNLASFVGGLVRGLDVDAQYLTEDERAGRLRALAERFEMTDADLIAKAERREIDPDPELAEWLVLLNRSDLLERD